MTDVEEGEGYGNTPYDHKKSPRDTELRSPIRYTKLITSPTFYFEGEEDYYYDADTMLIRCRLGPTQREHRLPPSQLRKVTTSTFSHRRLD